MVDRALLCLVVALAVGSGVSCKPDTPPDAADETGSSPTNVERSVVRPSVGVNAPAPRPEDRSSAPVEKVEPESTAIPVTAEVLERGSKAYQTGMCFKCHRDDGTGGPRAPNLTDSDWLHCDGSIDGIRQVLIDGVSRDQLKDSDRPHAMNPATNLIADDGQIAALAAYVYSLSRSR